MVGDRPRAFSSEVDTGSRKENASKQKDRARYDSIQSKSALEYFPFELNHYGALSFCFGAFSSNAFSSKAYPESDIG
jgi:hypothetical protein